MVLIAIVKFFLATTSLLRYAVAVELLLPFGSMKVTILVAPRLPLGVFTSLLGCAISFVSQEECKKDARVERYTHFC